LVRENNRSVGVVASQFHRKPVQRIHLIGIGFGGEEEFFERIYFVLLRKTERNK